MIAEGSGGVVESKQSDKEQSQEEHHEAFPQVAALSRPSTPGSRPQTAFSSRPEFGPGPVPGAVPMDEDKEGDEDDEDEEDGEMEVNLCEAARTIEESLPAFPSTIVANGSVEAVELGNSTVALLLMAQKEEWSRLLDEVAKSRAVGKHREFQIRTLKELLDKQRCETQKLQTELVTTDSERKELERDHAETLDELNNCRERVASMRLSCDAVQQLCEDRRSIQDMEKQVEQKLSDVRAGKAEDDKKKHEVEQQLRAYRKSLVTFCERSHALKQRLKVWTSQVDAMKKETMELKAEKEQTSKKIALLEEAVAAKDALLSQLKERLDHTLNLLEREKSSCRRFEEERTLLSIELASARNRNVDLSFQLSQRNGELSETVVNTQTEKASLLSSLQRAQNETNDKANRITRLEEELKVANEQVQAKETDASQLRKRLSELEAKNHEMTRRVHEMTIMSEIMQTARDDNRPRTAPTTNATQPGLVSDSWSQPRASSSAASSQQQQHTTASQSQQQQQQQQQQQNSQDSTSSSRPPAATDTRPPKRMIRVEDDEDDDEDILRDPFDYTSKGTTSSATTNSVTRAQQKSVASEPAELASSSKKAPAKRSSGGSTASQGANNNKKKKRASSNSQDQSDDGHCPLCKQDSLGLMYLCPMCLREYHASCVKNQAGGKSMNARGFICASCS